MVTIVDYGSGNLRSVQKAFERLGAEARITDDPQVVADAARLVLPGVGAFGDAMRELRSRCLVEPIVAHLRADRPFLGICMGLQLLFETGWEGGRQAGLGILAGEVTRFDLPAGMKVPHMGWNTVDWRGADSRRASVGDGNHFYFVHMQMPRKGRSARRWATIGSTRQRLRSSRIASPNDPTPGSTSRAASATTCGSSVIRASAPSRSKAFCTLRRLPLP
jgi:glutamine amidotransferase